jgi:pimeloyl-ACP methyl ester carboxylesterase
MESESTLSPDLLKERVAEVVHNPIKLAFVQALMRTMSDRFDERQLGVCNDLKQLAAITRLEISSIKCPTLVIHGDADGDVPFADACWAHEQISGSMIHAIPGGSHLGFWIAPGAKQAQQLALSWIAI